MSGGNDRGSYYAGLGYNRQEGLPVSTFYERYSFVLNASYKITDWLTSTSNFNYNRANWKTCRGQMEVKETILVVSCQLLLRLVLKTKMEIRL